MYSDMKRTSDYYTRISMVSRVQEGTSEGDWPLLVLWSALFTPLSKTKTSTNIVSKSKQCDASNIKLRVRKRLPT